MKWLKMGCGHLVALPLLFIFFAAGMEFWTALEKNQPSIESGVGAFVTGGIVVALLAYLWTQVWPDATEDIEQETSPIPEAEALPMTLLFSGLAIMAGNVALIVGMMNFVQGAKTVNWVSFLFWGFFFILWGVLSSGVLSGRSQWKRFLIWWRGVPDTAAEAPWTVRPAWRSSDIPETRSTEWQRIIIAGFCNVLGWPFLIVMLFKAGPNPVALLLPVIVLGVGLYYGWLAIQDLRRWRQFGLSTLSLDPMPARLGRTMRARLQTPIAPDNAPKEGFHVELACYEPVSDLGDEGPVRRQVWNEYVFVDEAEVSRAGQGLAVPVSFDLPSHKPPSPAVPFAKRIQWKLHVRADLPDTDYEATFEIPVFGPDDD